MCYYICFFLTCLQKAPSTQLHHQGSSYHQVSGEADVCGVLLQTIFFHLLFPSPGHLRGAGGYCRPVLQKCNTLHCFCICDVSSGLHPKPSCVPPWMK